MEATITGILEDAVAALQRVLAVSDYRAVVLMGGYGRGEGGVLREAGRERPHNNLDILVISRGHSAHGPLRQRAEAVLGPVAEQHGIGIDVGAVSEAALRRAECLVMWYDLRFGHKTLLGDPGFVPSLERFRLSRVQPADVRNLLVNRGSLLVINDVLLALRGDQDREVRRTVVKHAMKAIIGYGDALLFFLGEYDHSYVTKQQRMRLRLDVPTPFRRLYDAAMEFRFAPDYAAFQGDAFVGLSTGLAAELSEVHLQCERRRLGSPALTWSEYADRALRHSLLDGLARPRSLARKGLRLASDRGRSVRLVRSTQVGLGPRAWLGLAAGGAVGWLPIVFPAVAYPDAAPGFVGLAERLLRAPSGEAGALKRAYLDAWGTHVDINFHHALARLGVDLHGAPHDLPHR